MPPPPAPPPLAEAPLLELPEQQRFVVPEFIDDGPTRRARMRAAEIEADGGGAASPRAPRTGGEQQAPEPPAAREQRFEHAAEQALRSRHVPDAERAIVRRFFDKLQQQGR
ncbi:MAG: hypothetical protein H6835_12335 [Planctomycetes bacterium]|nr:hypothetical protein [Planctomycetota bacterium]